MKKLIIAAAVLAVSTAAAEAKCSKKALNGTWALAVGGEVAVIGTASGGVFTFTNGMDTLTLTLSTFSSTKCKGNGSGSEGGSPFTFKMASESIPGSAEKPNHLLAVLTDGGTSIPIVLKRQ
jgi:hypothetical protein